MEKSRRVLVLGDGSAGKTSFLDTLFDSYLPGPPLVKEYPKKSTGCNVAVHHLNQYYPELNDNFSLRQSVSSASPSSITPP